MDTLSPLSVYASIAFVKHPAHAGSVLSTFYGAGDTLWLSWFVGHWYLVVIIDNIKGFSESANSQKPIVVACDKVGKLGGAMASAEKLKANHNFFALNFSKNQNTPWCELANID